VAARWSRRSLLRRPRGALGAALLTTAALSEGDSTRNARRKTQRPAMRALAPGPGRRPSPAPRVCAPAVAVFLVCAFTAGALLCGVARADESPPTPPPTTTTPEAPPPDPYTTPAPASKPKSKPAPRPTTHVTRSAPAPVRHYTPPAPVQQSAPTYSAPTYTAPTYTPRPSTARVHRAVVKKKAVHKQRKHVVHRRAKPKPAPVKVTLAPLAHVLAAVKAPVPTAAVVTSGDKEPYLWLAGLAFALLAVAGLSLHLLSVRAFHLRFE
jgi:hypothetical protein